MINKKNILSVFMIGVLMAGSAAIPFEGLSPLTVTASAATTSQIDQLKSDVRTIANHINYVSYIKRGKSTNRYNVTCAYQRTINTLYNANVVVDGDFGPACEKATREIVQKSSGITADGIVGVGTLKVIQAKAAAYIDANTPKAVSISFGSMRCPSTLTQGSSYNLGGSITSSGAPISYFKGEILSGSTVIMSKTSYPNAYSVNIGSSAVNTGLTFAKLNAGSYTLRYTVTAGGTTKTYTQDFTVQAKKATISFNSMSAPSGSINQNKSFALSGTIKTTNQPIYSITAQIKNSSNSTVMSKTVYPNSFSYSIRGSALDVAMAFGSLSAGDHVLVYSVTAADGTTSSKTYSFTVKGTTPVINVPSSNSVNASKLIQAAYADIGKTSAQMGFSSGQNWCAYSVGKWLKSIGINIGNTASVNDVANGLVRNNYSSYAWVFKDTRNKYTNDNLSNLFGSKAQKIENRYDVTLEPGDIICFRWSNTQFENYSHIGIVVSYDPLTRKISTIEGNVGANATTSTVKCVERQFDSTVVAIVRLK